MQETLQFGPFGPHATLSRPTTSSSYDQNAPAAEPHPGQRDPASELFGQDIGGDDLPKGWSVDEEGYFQLDNKNYHDYWEIRAGCLIRHHLQPRHRPHDITTRPRTALLR